MPIIKCPDCGNMISTLAQQCPKCGRPMKAVTTLTTGFMTPPSPPSHLESDPKTKGQIYKCCKCRAQINKSEIDWDGWATCPVCKTEQKMPGYSNISSRNQVHKIIPFMLSAEEMHKHFMQWMIENCEENVFDKIKIIEQKKLLFEAREFGTSNQRALFPMCNYGKEIFKKLTRTTDNPQGTSYLYCNIYDKYFKGNIEDYSPKLKEDATLIKNEFSERESKRQFSQTDIGSLKETDFYYAIPIFEETFEYEGEQYKFIGLFSGKKMLFSTDDFPQDFFFQSKPSYTTSEPVHTLFIVAFLFLIIYLFKEWKWGWLLIIATVFGVTTAAGCPEFVTNLIHLMAFPIDSMIQTITNQRRRTKFREDWDKRMEYKKWSAHNNFNVELYYETPDFPTPPNKIKL